MKKGIDFYVKECNNIITLIKHLIKEVNKARMIFMLQQIMTKPGEIIFKEVPLAKLEKGQVMVKIRNIGICGSDIHVYHGKHPFTSYPVTQGHEVSGEITELGEAMLEAFGPDKADVIYDCAGNNITMGQAIKYARKGSIIVLVAVFAGMAEVDLAVANDHELDIKSTMMYRHDDYLDGIRLVKEGRVLLQPLISKTFAFRDYLQAYQYIDKNRETTMKVIINVQE